MIRVLGPGDEAVLDRVGEGVFDEAIDPALAREFLADSRHHLCVAVDDGVVVGFASALHYIHPDKPAELWVNEVGVANTHRERGVAKAILAVLFEHARTLGCKQAWVLTEGSNVAALKLYHATGGKPTAIHPVLFEFDLVPPEGTKDP